MSSRIEKGSLVNAHVSALMPFGLLVKIDNGPVGMIREREIAWERNVRRGWRDIYSPGDALQVVVLGQDRSGCVDLSLRLAQNDPWLDLAMRYHVDQLVDGVVTGIQSYGAFVEIEPGVTGLLHRSRIPTWAGKDLLDLFWPGDLVNVVIEAMELEHRRLTLGMSRAWAQRWQTTDTGQGKLPHVKSATDAHQGITSEPESATQLTQQIVLLGNRPSSILVVEDDKVQCTAMANWLRKAGQHVLTALSGEEALLLLESERTDWILMDLGLPGMNGIESLRRIHARWPEVQGVVMTDWARADEHMSELEALRMDGARLLIKPLLPEDLLGILLNPQRDEASVSGAEPAAEQFAVAAGASRTLSPAHKSKQEVLAHLQSLTRASKIVLFALDPAQRRTKVLAQSGSIQLSEAAIPDLIYSPVRDSAEDEVVVRIRDTQSAEARVHYLKPLLPFRSCLGIPVVGDLADRHALFLFYSRPNAVSEADEGGAQASAIALGALLEHQQLQECTVQMQRLALLGHLSRALVHEINHQLSPIGFALTDLEEQCAAIEGHAEESSGSVAGEVHQARITLQNLGSGLHNLIGTARLFGQVAVSGKEQTLRLDAVVEEAIRLARDMADRAHVSIEVLPPPRLLFTRAQAAQVQQVLLNVIINAIQQIFLLRPEQGGRVVIWLGQKQSGSHPMLEVHVEDDGPGIHRRLWERVFELGFTTRHEEGSGLGLYIVRSLVEGMGGQVRVAESHVLWGTTFTIELPFRL